MSLAEIYAYAYTTAMDIKATRTALSLTQAELAAKLGVTQATVSRFETGELEIDTRTRLALEALRLKAAA